MDTNHTNRPRRRGKTLAAATLAAAALGICGALAATAATSEDRASADWERCVVVSKDALYSGDVHDAFLC
jgi:uncharacterized membrane protein